MLVMLSRMYLGQHYLTDVIAGAAIGIIVGTAGYFLFDLLGDGEEKLMYFIVPCCIVLFIAALVMLVVKSEEFDSVVKVAGTYMAASIGYFIEKRRIKSEVAVSAKYRAMRLSLGLIVTAAIHIGLKLLFELVDNSVLSLVLDFIRYALLGFWVTLIAPMAFAKLKI